MNRILKVYVWKATEEDLSIAKKIIELIKGKIEPTIETSILDLAIIQDDEDTDALYISFGTFANAQHSSSKKGWVLPELARLRPHPDNKTSRADTLQKISSIAEEISDIVSKEPVECHIEHAQGATIGTSEICDIQLTPEQIDSLNKLKDLLGGGKIVITKDNLKIEIEERNTSDAIH